MKMEDRKMTEMAEKDGKVAENGDAYGNSAENGLLAEKCQELAERLQYPLSRTEITALQNLVTKYYELSEKAQHWLSMDEIDAAEELPSYAVIYAKVGRLRNIRYLARRCFNASFELTEEKLVRIYYEESKCCGSWLNLKQVIENPRLPSIKKLYNVTSLKNLRELACGRYGDITQDAKRTDERKAGWN